MGMADKDRKQNVSPPHTAGQTVVTTEMMAACCKRVVHYLKTEKRYTQPSYSLWELSRETGMTTRLVSKSINEYMGQNFFVLINRMRVEEAKRLLRNAAKSARKISLEEIGAQSGFHSRSSFFSCFKGYEGISPGKYMTLHEDRE